MTGHIYMEGARAYLKLYEGDNESSIDTTPTTTLHFKTGTSVQGLTLEGTTTGALAAPVSDEWIKFSYTVVPTKNYMKIQMHGQSEGTYFDNISFRKVDDNSECITNGDFETAGENIATDANDVFAGWTEIRADVAQSQNLTYKDGDIADVYSNTRAFYINASGTQNFDNLKITPYIESTTGVVKNLKTFTAN